VSNRFRPLWAVVAFLLLAGCSDSGVEPVLRFEEVRWDASLGINPAQFTELSTGVWIRDDEVGGGATAANGDRLRTHYTGWLANGTLFDTSLEGASPTPITFVLGARQMIRGYELASAGMRVGGTRTVLIPPYLGYGSSPPPGGAIPRNAWLVFRIQLVELTR
jgi:FKBP-type peptidyl-prolyl cis-trans isomerase